MTDGLYLLTALFDAGPTKAGAASEVALEWADIWAFMCATEAISEPWEAQALRNLSNAYLDAKEAGKNPLCIPPIDQD